MTSNGFVILLTATVFVCVSLSSTQAASKHELNSDWIPKVKGSCEPTTWREYTDMNMLGGRSQSSSTTLFSCQLACESDPQCTSIGWHAAASPSLRCWHHGPWSAGNSRKQSNGIDHYDLTRNIRCAGLCDPTTWTEYTDMIVFGGRAQSSSTTLFSCQSTCVSDPRCTSIGWNAAELPSLKCWHHGPWSAGNCRHQYIGLDHYELTRNTQCIVKGLCGPTTWTEYTDMNMLGGRSQSSSTTLFSCQSACESDPQCTSIDWNAAASPSLRCWHHGPWSAGNCRKQLNGVDHYELTRNTRCTGSCEPTTWTEYTDMNMLGGRSQSSSTTLFSCQSACVSDPQCTSIDWHAAASPSLKCWHHGPWSAGNSRNHWNGLDHYELTRNTQCIEDLLRMEELQQQKTCVCKEAPKTKFRHPLNLTTLGVVLIVFAILLFLTHILSFIIFIYWNLRKWKKDGKRRTEGEIVLRHATVTRKLSYPAGIRRS